MTQRTGAAIDVHHVMAEAQLFHRDHRDHSEGFVDFPEIHIVLGPARLLQNLAHGRNRRGGEIGRLVGVSGGGDDLRQRLEAAAFRFALTHHHQRSCAIGNGGGVRRGHGAILAKGRFQARDLFRARLAGQLVGLDHRLALAVLDGDRGDLALEIALFGGADGAGEGFQRIGVLVLTGELVLTGDHVGEHAHGVAFIGVLETILGHVILDHVMAILEAGAVVRQQVRRVSHGFHAARHDHRGVARGDGGAAHDGGLHAGAAHLVQRGRLDRFGQTALDGRLARRGLALASAEHIAHVDEVHIVACDAGFGERGLDRFGAQLIGGQARQFTHQAAHRGASHTNDDNRIFGTHGPSPIIIAAGSAAGHWAGEKGLVSHRVKSARIRSSPAQDASGPARPR